MPRPARNAEPSPQGSGEKAASPQVSRAFMAGSLVPPRPLNTRPTAQPMPEAPRRPAPAPTPAAPTPAASNPVAPAAAESARSDPGARPISEARPGGQRAHGITPVAPRAEPEVAAAKVAVPAAAEAAADESPAAPRRTAKNVRQFNAAVAADARGKTAGRGLPGKTLLLGAAAVIGVAAIGAGAWFMTHRGPTLGGAGIAGQTATEVSLAPATPPTAAAAVADSVDETIGGVTEAPSQDAPEAATTAPASVPATVPALTANGPQRAPGNFEALAPATRAPAARPPAATRTVEVGPDGLPQISAATRALAEGQSPAASTPAPAPAAAAPVALPPPPPPVIRLPSPDDPFTTNPSNPEPGG
jgi:hypothetical protein